MSSESRTLLGRTRWAGTNIFVYQMPGWLEIDESEEYEVRRRRIFFDEIRLVTYNRVTGWPAVVTCLVLAAVFAGLAAWVWLLGGERAGAVALALLGVPFLGWALVRVLLRIDRVTVFGPRTRARMDFTFRKARAREVFDLVCRLAQEHQSRAAQSSF
jgi:hypothetical protein